MNILELYSGIGGMHLALKKSGIKGDIVCSIEINPSANKVYMHNFPDTLLLNYNLENLTAEFVNQLNVDTILMSPPCQPFTRNGLKKDVQDPRTSSFLRILSILPNTQVRKILIENVKGFETSEMRENLLHTLKECHFIFQEFILSPTQFGIPNTRYRYYCLAKKLPDNFPFQVGPLMTKLPDTPDIDIQFSLSKVVEENPNKKFKISDHILRKYFSVIDICGADSKRSCCFTKGYSRYIHGTGSVYSDKTELQVASVLKNVNKCQIQQDKDLTEIKELNLRFFTPKEISRLMCFPENYSFPSEISDKQKYMMLGNSINVAVVSELIQLLINS